MKPHVATAILLSLGLACGSSSSPAKVDGSTQGNANDYACYIPDSGSPVCDIAKNPSADQLAAAQAGCAANQGTKVTSCPTAQLVGCCTGDGSEVCYYYGAASDFEGSCTSAGYAWSTTI